MHHPRPCLVQFPSPETHAGSVCLNHTIEKEGEGDDALKENSDASARGESVLSVSSPSLSSAVVSLLWLQWAGKLFNPQSTSNKFCFES